MCAQFRVVLGSVVEGEKKEDDMIQGYMTVSLLQIESHLFREYFTSVRSNWVLFIVFISFEFHLVRAVSFNSLPILFITLRIRYRRIFRGRNRRISFKFIGILFYHLFYI